MGEIEDLKEKLALLKENKRKDEEIRELRKQIKNEEFSQTTSGKVFNKIANVGKGLGKMIDGSEKQKTSPKKKKVKTIEEVMRDMPQ